jgi:hypothetical protein
MGLAEKLALPFLALCWASAIVVMIWHIFRRPPKPHRLSTAPTPGKTRPVGSEKVPPVRRRPLVR